MSKITNAKLNRKFDMVAGIPIEREFVLPPKEKIKEKCPKCKEPIYLSEGQRVFGCGNCRKEIREHNRRYLNG